MGKLGKRIIAMALATMMLLSVSMIAGAAASTETASVIVSTTEMSLEDDAVTLVKIFDVEINSDTGATTYTLCSEVEGFFKQAIINEGAFSSLSGTELSTAVVSYIEGLADDEQTLSDLSKALWVWAIQPENQVNLQSYTGTFTKESDTTCTATISGVEYGYYLGYSSGNQISLFDVSGATVTVHLKTKTPSVVKTVDEESVEIGETVTFTVTTYIPDTEYEGYKLIVHDMLGVGFTYVNPSIVVTMDGSTLIAGVGYTTTNAVVNETTDSEYYGTTSFSVNLSNVVTTANAGKVIQITYSAMLDGDAKVEEEVNKNIAYLEYSDSDSSTYKDTDNVSTTETSTFDIDVKKIADTADTKTLSGASFELYRSDSEGNITGSAVALVDLKDGDYRLATKYDATTTYAMVSGTDGLINLKGVDEGIYYLKETVAPEGYNVLTEPVQFEVVATYSSGSVSGSTVAYTDTDGTETTLTGSNPIIVVNKAGITLPTTGAAGTILLTVMGTLAVIGGTLYIIMKKRRTARA